MVRNIVMTLGLIVALLPFLGLPYELSRWVWTFAGFAIVVILFFSKRSRVRREVNQHSEISGEGDAPRALHVERMEIEDRPRMHLERKTVVDTMRRHEDANTDTLVEKKTTVVRRRRQKADIKSEQEAKSE